MGPESNGGTFVACIDGQPVEIRGPLPTVTIDDVSEDMKNAGKILDAWADFHITMEIAGDVLADFFRETELHFAICIASYFEPAMVHRYRHTKKKRTRKKYEKRILAWFREVFR